MPAWKKPATATIVITTKNRRDDLWKALASCITQTASPEIVVIDDGSSDGTSEMVAGEFPAIRLIRHDESRGLIVRRNEAARLATGDVIVSMDDDAEFSDVRIVELTLQEFVDERIAAVAMPFINVKQSPAIRQRSPSEGVWLTNEFIGTAYAIRRDVFERLGGFREALFHQGEEGDFCLRLLDAGYVVRLGASEPILHYESSTRDKRRMEIFGQRNLMLFAWHNVPASMLPVHLLATVWNGVAWGVRRGCLWDRCVGTWRGAVAVAQQWRRRRPVSRNAYCLYRRLKKQGPAEFSQVCDDRRRESAWPTAPEPCRGAT